MLSLIKMRIACAAFVAALLALLGASVPALAQCGGLPSGNTVCASPSGGGSGFPAFRALGSADVSGVTLPWSKITSTPTTIAGYGITNARTQLTSSQSYWLNANGSATAPCGPTGASTCSAGNDNNDCLTPATSCQTPQALINKIIGHVDTAGFSVAVFPAHGTYLGFTCFSGPVIGTSTISIQGDANAPAAVIFQAQLGTGGGSNAIATVKDGCTVGFSNVEFIDNATNNASNYVNTGTGNCGHVDLSNITFGAMGAGAAALSSSYCGSITLTGSNSQLGSMNALLSVGAGGVIDVPGTVAGSSGITWGTGAAVIQSGGVITSLQRLSSGSPTFTGYSGVGGPRCFISSLATPDLANPNSIFPGGSDCVAQMYVGALGLQTGTGSSSTIDFGTQHWPLTSGGSSSAHNLYEKLTNAGLANPSVTVGGQTCTLGASCEARQFNAHGNLTIAAGTTVFCNGTCQPTQVAASDALPAGQTAVIKNLNFSIATAPAAAQSVTITLFVGTFGSTSATALTCTVAAAATNCTDVTHTVTLSAGQAYTWQVVTGATNATGGSALGYEIDNP